MSNEELIWVDKDFAEKWNELKTKKAEREQKLQVFEEYMKTVNDEVTSNFRWDLESLEEDAAMFSGLMLHVKKSFEKAKNEHLEASSALWDKFEQEIPSVQLKVSNIIEVLKPLENQLATINNLLGKLTTYNIDRFLETLRALNNLYGKQKEMVQFLVNHFGEKTED